MSGSVPFFRVTCADETRTYEWDTDLLSWVPCVKSAGTGGPSSDVNVLNFPASQAVTGTFWQATQPVSGPLTDTQLRASAVPVSGTFFQATQPVSIATMPSTPVTGTFWQTTQPVSGPLTDTQLRATAVPVSGTFWQATQPVSGTVTANAGTGPFPVSDNAGSLTVDAPVGTPVFARLSDGSAALVGQKAMSASLPVVIASDQGAISTQKAPTGGTNVLKTGTITTTATTADQVVLTYTVTSGKTFYLQYVVMYGRLTTLSATATILGAISLETPSGTKVLTFDDVNPTTSELEFNPMPFPEPIPVAAGVVVRVVVTPAATTSMLWRANFGGYEK